MEGNHSEIIRRKLDYRPNTDGKQADKYIEIDLSQQRMYLFRDGEIYTSYPISSGRYFPTPTGVFTILNKAPNAYSDIYHVWMPYWMAFFYHSQLKAYFGIHELPYWLTANGQKIQRPREFIGSPNTGGCIALDVDTARQVYAFGDIGMPVYIYD
jgi:lipoprotein-anchoring transpeptidase ErfK/SrfK